MKKRTSRREFFKVVGSAGLGSLFAADVLASQGCKKAGSPCSKEKKTSKYPRLPQRVLGKTNAKVPVLSNGVMFDVVDNQIALRANLMHGVTYWDTAHGYAGGNSERGVGEFFKKNPDVRKDVFLVTKASGAKNLDEVEQRLAESLKRMNTNYIDLYYGVHACSDPDKQLTPELAKWAESAKKRKLIKYFGFSTHKNMAKCLMAAAKLPWIDAIMTSYNISLMQNAEMQEAVQACHEAKVGLIAMKVIKQSQKKLPEAEEELIAHFLEKGYTRGQALIKAVLSDKRFTVACIRMENVTLIKSNVAAVLDKKELGPDDLEALKKYAADSCTGYCAGCSEICANACPEMPYTAEVMRYLMYYKSYGDTDNAKQLFSQLPDSAHQRLRSADYRLAEARCPQHMPIAQLMAEAVQKLA
jgi:predicted aldo/keto reductase-like oxidoreductase